jgi:hypothetical protein
VQVSNSSTEAMTIARDSLGRVWAAWTAGRRVWVTHTLGDDLSWATPFVLPVNTTDIAPGDITQIVGFQGNRVGIMWSDHVTDAFWFTYHQDGAPSAAWSVPEPAQAGPDQADDHIHMKATADGRVFAILKNELDETWVRVRDVSGSWTGHLVSGPADGWTRSILALDEESRRLMVFGTEPVGGGTIYAKVSSLDNPGFAPGRGYPFMRLGVDSLLNDATSTKQSVSSATGLVVLASHQPARHYWFRGVPLRSGGTARPVPAFDAGPRTGSVARGRRVKDTASGGPGAGLWSLGGGATTTRRKPRDG